MSRRQLASLFLATITTSLVLCVSSKTVVFLPFVVSSHTSVHGFVAQELSALGHNVWIGIPESLAHRDAKAFQGLKVFSLGPEYEDLETQFITVSDEKGSYATEDSISLWSVEKNERLQNEILLRLMSEEFFMEKIRNIAPDLIVVDWDPRVNQLLAVPYKLGVPFAILSPRHDAVTGRIPFSPAASAFYFKGYHNDSQPFIERFFFTIAQMYPVICDLLYDRGFIQTFVPEKPYITTHDLTSKAEVFLIESDHILDFPHPSLPNVKFVGGISPSPGQPVQNPYKDFVEKAEAIAVISFGGMIMDFPPEITTKILNALSQLDLKVVWRANISSPDVTKILTSTWIPQNDLLAHKKTKVFVSHCGTHAQYESLYHAVPVLCLPLFYDQFYNAHRFRQKGFGLFACLDSVSEDELASLIRQVAKEDKYRSAMTKASTLYHLLYKNPRKEAAFWLDHVMRFGGSYMRFSGQEMPLYQFLCLDILAVILCIIFVCVVVVTILLKCVCRSCCRKDTLSKDKKNN